VSAFSEADRRVMAGDDSENFRVRPGRSRNGGARINPRTQPFLKQVQIAVRKARAFYRGWYNELVTEVPVIKDGYVYPMQGEGLCTDLKPAVYQRSDLTVRRTNV